MDLHKTHRARAAHLADSCTQGQEQDLKLRYGEYIGFIESNMLRMRLRRVRKHTVLHSDTITVSTHNTNMLISTFTINIYYTQN